MSIEFEINWKVWIFAIGIDFDGPVRGGIMLGPLAITIEGK